RRGPVGHRPRGLLGGGYLLGVLPARPRAEPRLSLGGGRAPRLHGPAEPRLLRDRALERAGPDPEGAALRPHGARRQPRRGREGGLLLPRRHADVVLREGPLSLSSR